MVTVGAHAEVVKGSMDEAVEVPAEFCAHAR